MQGVERDRELIAKAPKLGLFKVERPEIEAWDFEQYARLLASAKIEGADWYAAVCLAGEAGLRSGEVKALRWREDVDLFAKTITVNQQTCHVYSYPERHPQGEPGMPLVVQIAQYLCAAAVCGATWRILPRFLALQRRLGTDPPRGAFVIPCAAAVVVAAALS